MASKREKGLAAAMAMAVALGGELRDRFAGTGGAIWGPLNRLRRASEEALKASVLGRVTKGDQVAIAEKIAEFNRMGFGNAPSWCLYVSFNIVLTCDRMIELRQAGSPKAGLLADILAALVELYDHFDVQDHNDDYDVAAYRAYLVWEGLEA